MATQGTKAEISAIEEDAIECFRNGFKKLCEEYGINAMCVGTRKETDKFTDQPEASMCAAFIMSEVSNPSIREAKAINEAYGRSQEVVSKIVIGAVFNEIKEDCDCPECMKKDKNCEVKVETKFGVDTTAGENIAKAGPSAV